MDIVDAASSGTLITRSRNFMPTALRQRTLSTPPLPRSLRTVIEHIPFVNARRLKLEKYAFLSIIFLLNGLIIYLSRSLTKFYWILIPILMLRPMVDFVEISLIIIFYIRKCTTKQAPKVPDTPENLVYLLCCYNESHAEIVNSMNSLAEQKSLDAHNKAIVMVCDGRHKGKGMLKTTAAYLTEDIIEHVSSSKLSNAYTAWDDTLMDVEVVTGEFRGLPVFCIIKKENRGKRDGIILVRSFLHKFNQSRSDLASKSYSPDFTTKFNDFLTNSASIQSVEYVVGIDADTRFDVECVFKLMQTARDGEKVIGVTGYITPDPTMTKPYSLSYLYQNAEYMVGQYRRRLRQDLTSRKVTCLPGCCQLLRVVESTCGDKIMRQFGYYPRNSDGLFRTVRSMMSEDRDHVCLILREYADVETRLCLSARAYTTVPGTFSVFLSQRRRWTLGPITSDLLLLTRRSTGWLERVAATSSVLHWTINLSTFFAWIIREEPDATTLYVFYLLWLFRSIWDIAIFFMSSRTLTEGIQYLSGAVIYHFICPYVSLVVQLFTFYNLDDFRWGKTRVVVEEE